MTRQHEVVLDRPRLAVAKIQSIGRIALPPEALRALAQPPGEAAELWGRRSRLALVLRRDTRGAPFRVDGRGRLYLPVWMRRGAAVLVGTRLDPPLVVIAPVGVLDGIGDVLVGQQQ